MLAQAKNKCPRCKLREEGRSNLSPTEWDMWLLCSKCNSELIGKTRLRRLKEKVLERDNYKCQKCFDKERCEISGSRFKLEVHHKIPLSKGGKDELDNLITLCFKCHRNKGLHNES